MLRLLFLTLFVGDRPSRSSLEYRRMQYDAESMGHRAIAAFFSRKARLAAWYEALE